MAHPPWWGSAFEHLASVSPLRIAVVRWEGGDDAVVEWANPATATLLGRPDRDIVGRRVSEVCPTQYVAEIVEQFRQARRDGRLFYEVVRELPTGRRTLDAVTVAMEDDLFVSIALDITAQREAQRRLDEVSRITGTGLYHWNVADGSVGWTDELFVRVGGQIRTVDDRAEQVTDATGRPLYVLGVIRDVTDEVELQRQAELLHRAEEQQRTALTVHDKVVQALATVVLALDLGEVGTARSEAMAAVTAAQTVVAELLGEVADVHGTIAPGALRVVSAGEEPT
jgi:PAS domain-containing protein